MRRVRAYTLLEILIVLAVLAGATVGVLRLFSMSDVKAETQKEQQSISALVEAVRGVYATAPSYEGVDMALVSKQASLRGVLRADGLPVSAFGGGLLTLRPATIRAADDAFSITIGQLDRGACAAVIPALAGQTTQVSTISGGNIQQQPHRVPDGAAIAKACAGGFFQKGTGSVSLVYYRPRATGNAVARGPSCAVSCSPQTETQTIQCPTGQTGQINQTREDTCSTDACPVPIVGSWTTVSSSCAAPAAPIVPIVPTAPKDPALACTPRVQIRSLGCPQPQLGRINQQQAITCDANGGQHVGPWTKVSDTCLPPPLPCQSGVLTGSDACAAGQFGEVAWFKELTCAGGGLMIGPKKITGNSCAPTGTCRPSSRPGPTQTTACPAGQAGQITSTTTEYSTCASATALPVWGPAQITSTTDTCGPSVPGPVIDFEVGFWGGYAWNEVKPGWGVCNAPVSFNSWILFNQDDTDAAATDHYVVSIARKGITQTVMIPAAQMGKNAAPSAPQPDGRQYWYQSWAGVFDAPTVKALTPDIDWSLPAYTSATTNGGGGITIQPEMCGATIAITACNSSGQCSVPTTQTDGVSVFSSGERDCQASETGSVPPWPASARQCTKAGLPKPPLNGCGDPCAAHGGMAGWFTGQWLRPGVPLCVAALPYCEPDPAPIEPSCPWVGGGDAPSWCSPVHGGWHCDAHGSKPSIDYVCK